MALVCLCGRLSIVIAIELEQIIFGHWLCVEVALYTIDSDLRQRSYFFCGFRTLCNDVQAHVVEDTRKRLNDVGACVAVRQACVDLDDLEGELHEAVEIGITNAEIVEIEAEAVVGQLLHDVLRLRKAIEDRSLREFQTDPTVRNVCLIHRADEAGNESLFRKLCHGDVDGNADVFQLRLVQILADLL